MNEIEGVSYLEGLVLSDSQLPGVFSEVQLADGNEVFLLLSINIRTQINRDTSVRNQGLGSIKIYVK